MWWNDPRLPQIEAWREEIEATEGFAPVSEGLSAEALWGELRALSNHRFEGAERWSKWLALFEAFKQDAERDAAIAYLARAWELPTPTLAGLRVEFKQRLMLAQANSLRGVVDVDDDLSPPLPLEELEAWEQLYQVRIPEPLRRFVLEISAGYMLKEEEFTFDLRDEEMFKPHREHLDEWFDDGMPWYRDTLSAVLAHLESRDLETFHEPLKLACPLDDALMGQSSAEVAESTLVMRAYMEGNHGDDQTLLITRGPLTGYMLHADTVIHAGEDGQGASFHFSGEHVGDWLYDWLWRRWVLDHDV